MGSLRTATSVRWWALGAICLGLLAVGLDSTVLSLALPTLSGALRASESDLQWFVTAYTLALTAAMLPAGLLGDRYGRKRTLVVSLVVFGAASAGCALSRGPGAFTAARALLGVSGAGMIVMALAVITAIFPPAERARAIGIWATANFIALPIGPLLGGWMLQHVWWGWVFLLNLPAVLVGLLAVVAFVPETRAPVRPSVDWPGVVASSLGLTAVMFGVIQAGQHGWSSPRCWTALLGGVLLLAGLVSWERHLLARGRSPLVDPTLFAVPSFSAGLGLAALGIFGLFGLLFLLPQYWQAVLGLGTQAAGVRLIPIIAGMAAGAVLADRTVTRIGARATSAAGFAVIALALLASSRTVHAASAWPLAGSTLLAGLGAGLALATAATAAIVELDAERAGVGTALVQAVTKLGPALGAAILGALLTATYQRLVPTAGLPEAMADTVRSGIFGGLAVARELHAPALAVGVQAAFTAGVHDALRWAALAVACGVPVAWLFLPRKRTTTTAALAGPAESTHERTAVPR